MQNDNIREFKRPNGSFGSAIRELFDSLQAVIRSEIQLAKSEATESVSFAAKNIGRAAAGGFVAFLGIPPFMAFLVIGLGELLGNNFWLSALIVSVVFLTTGGLVAMRFVN